MSRPITESQQRNRAEQTRLYGAPLGELIAQVAEAFDISQGRLAQLLGLSAPMVSQLASGHRVKIGNPAAVARLHRMIGLAREVADGRLDAPLAIAALGDDREDKILTRSSQLTRREGAAEVQQLLRSVASAGELVAAAALLDPHYPALAEILRIYGAGRNDEAVHHFERTVLGWDEQVR